MDDDEAPLVVVACGLTRKLLEKDREFREAFRKSVANGETDVDNYGDGFLKRDEWDIAITVWPNTESNELVVTTVVGLKMQCYLSATRITIYNLPETKKHRIAETGLLAEVIENDLYPQDTRITGTEEDGKSIKINIENDGLLPVDFVYL